jgi:HAD superfamily hydrolase (TIGR01509 family)
MPHPVNAILLDWGETLVVVPNMLTSLEQHIACLEEVFFSPRCDGEVALSDCGVGWPSFLDAYIEAARTRIRVSRATQREHSFEDRFAHALKLAGATREHLLDLAQLAVRFGRNIVQKAQLIDGAAEIVPQLAARVRLGLVSNYPYAPVVHETLDRFGLRRYFSGIVVSGELGVLKPHPAIYREALDRLGSPARETVFVGDDLDNDVIAPRALGMRVVWFTDQSAPCGHADAKISRLPDLLPWLDRAAQ